MCMYDLLTEVAVQRISKILLEKQRANVYHWICILATSRFCILQVM